MTQRSATEVLDLAGLYEALSGQLAQIVRTEVRAPEAVIEDACQFAWSRLVHHSSRVQRECVLRWLITTAVREAVKSMRRDGRCLPLEVVWCDEAAPAPQPGPDELVELRRRLGVIGELPERQQLVLWLHAVGLRYDEIALYTGYSLRTVERQLLRAKRSARALAAA